LPLLLYYDYPVDVAASRCPILMCDHYFGQRRARLHRGAASSSALGGGGGGGGSTSPRARADLSLSTASVSLVSLRGSQGTFGSSGRPVSASHLAA